MMSDNSAQRWPPHCRVETVLQQDQRWQIQTMIQKYESRVVDVTLKRELRIQK